ncbi:unnamed protein product [Acanthosepion pharaonis]|uniref:Uncharacterized protein n=1 Tax=Acanthosepion pharaonis TaxID=158019 RepID=A0A812C362_ACAPH|nr:unnamed protein product [Sepia pharaonis]
MHDSSHTLISSPSVLPQTPIQKSFLILFSANVRTDSTTHPPSSLGFVVAVIGFMVTTLIFPRLLRPSLLRNLLPGTRSLVSHRSAYSKRCVVVHEEGKTQQGAMSLCNFFSLHSTARDYEIEMRAKEGKGQHSTLPSQHTHPTPSFLGASVLKSRLRDGFVG